MQASMPDFVSFEPDRLQNLQSESRKCISHTPLPRIGEGVHFVCRGLGLHVLLSLGGPIMMCWPQWETGLQRRISVPAAAPPQPRSRPLITATTGKQSRLDAHRLLFLNRRETCSRSRLPATLLLFVALIFLTGCQKPDDIVRYTVGRPPQSRIGADTADSSDDEWISVSFWGNHSQGERTWFFKVIGPWTKSNRSWSRFWHS